jgi:DNA-binding SARP family transcriptional activator
VLWRLRDCGRDLLDVRDGTIALRVGVRVDVEDLVRTVRDAVDRAPVGRIGIRELVDVGELLPGWYDEWVLGERERLGQLRLHALESLALQVMAEGRYATAMELALAAVRTEPHRDSANRAVIRIHLAEGNLMDAVRYYRRFRLQQLQGLGVEPSEETRSLVRPLLGSTTAPGATATTSPGATGRPVTPSARTVAAGASGLRATASAPVVPSRVVPSRPASRPESWR